MNTETNPLILVVAASSKVGALVVKELLNRKANVRALVRSAARAQEMFGDAVELYKGFDFNNPETAMAALSGVEKLYLVSSPDVNAFEQSLGLLDAAKVAKVRHIVRLSVFQCSDTAKGFGASYVGKRHRAVEQYIESNGFTFTHLRPTWFYQNFEGIGGQEIREKGTVSFPLGDARVNYIDLRDIAEVAARVLSEPGHENKVYELATNELTMSEAVDILSRATGKTIRYLDQAPAVEYGARISYEEAKRFLPEAGNSPDELEAIGAGHWQQVKLGNITGITQDVEQVTGHKGITFEQYVTDNLQEFLPKATG